MHKTITNKSYAVEVPGTSGCLFNSGNRCLEYLSRALLPLIVSARHFPVPNQRKFGH